MWQDTTDSTVHSSFKQSEILVLIMFAVTTFSASEAIIYLLDAPDLSLAAAPQVVVTGRREALKKICLFWSKMAFSGGENF